MGEYKITNKSDRMVRVPGPGDLTLAPRESIRISTSSFSLTMANSNMLLDVKQIGAGKPTSLPVKSVGKVLGKKTVKRAVAPKKVPAKSQADSKKVNNDG